MHCLSRHPPEAQKLADGLGTVLGIQGRVPPSKYRDQQHEAREVLTSELIYVSVSELLWRDLPHELLGRACTCNAATGPCLLGSISVALLHRTRSLTQLLKE